MNSGLFVCGVCIIRGHCNGRAYSHITNEMRKTAAAKIEKGIAKAMPQSAAENAPKERTMTTFQTKKRWQRKASRKRQRLAGEGLQRVVFCCLRAKIWSRNTFVNKRKGK